MRLVKIRNASQVRQTVPGWGQAGPGECLQVAPDAARHLMASEAWEDTKDRKQRRAKQKDKEVTDGSD